MIKQRTNIWTTMVYMTKKIKNRLSVILVMLVSISYGYAQKTANRDEAKVGEYTLPSVLTLASGKTITDKSAWPARRKEILQLFQENVYGRFPGKPKDIHFSVLKEDKAALSGNAIARQVRIYFTKEISAPFMDVILYLPVRAKNPVPVFVGLNFKGNQCINTDSNIVLSDKYAELLKQTGKQEDPTARGVQAHRWELDSLIAKGFAVATAYYGDLELDYPKGWTTGIRTSLAKELNIEPTEWAAVGAWSWGLCRIVDYLETVKEVDTGKVAIIGHSRLGKAALWAAANDERFAAVISNNSGEAGAALARRWFGETVERINKTFPYWFVDKYKTYSKAVDQLPVDQHMLLALIAPRPLYVASATRDLWADPKGEFLALKNAEPVYDLFGIEGLPTKNIPKPDTSIGKTIRYHIRTGKHDIVLFDWKNYMRFLSEI